MQKDERTICRFSPLLQNESAFFVLLCLIILIHLNSYAHKQACQFINCAENSYYQCMRHINNAQKSQKKILNNTSTKTDFENVLIDVKR